MADEGKTIINVTVQAGAEYVQEKHVGYQIGKVEAGGIGIQVVQGGQKSPKAAGGRQGFKVVSNVFTYKWAKQHPERVTAFYQYLVQLRAIDKDTDHEEFEKLFLGVPTDIIVRWLAPKSALKALMSELKRRQYITPAGPVWKITESKNVVNPREKVFSAMPTIIGWPFSFTTKVDMMSVMHIATAMATATDRKMLRRK